MSASTGPVLAAGAIVLFTDMVVLGRPIGTEAKVIVGTGITALGLFGIEQISPGGATALAYLILVSVLFVRHDPTTKSPAEAFQTWYQQK